MQQPAMPPVVEISNGVRLVGPCIGRGRMPSTPSCFHPSRARWQQQGFAETEQVRSLSFDMFFCRMHVHLCCHYI